MNKISLFLLGTFLMFGCGGNTESNQENTEESTEIEATNTEESPKTETPETSENQVDWTGEYTYEEIGGPGMGGDPRQWFFTIIIAKNGDKYTANYDVDGYQTMARLLLSGKEEDGKLALYFDGVGEEHMMGYEGSEGEKYATITKKEDGNLNINSSGSDMIFVKKTK